MYPGSEREAIQSIITSSRRRCVNIGTCWLVAATLLLQFSYFIPASSSASIAQFTTALWLSQGLQALSALLGIILSVIILTKQTPHQPWLQLFQIISLSLSWGLTIYHVGFSWQQPASAGHLTLFALFSFIIALYASERLLLIPLTMVFSLHLWLRLPLNPGAEIADLLTILRQPLVGAMAFFSLNYWFRTALSREQDNFILTAEITRQAETDALTDLPNRRSFDQTLGKMLEQAQQTGSPLNMIILDIDYFKRINDQLGHPTGDQCLRQLAQVIHTVTQPHGLFAARIGGEEFALLLSDHSSDSAQAIAQQVKHQLHAAAIPHPDSPLSNYLTVSQGVGTFTTGMDTSALYSSADEALYYAKEHGRNQVCTLIDTQTAETAT